MKPANRSLGVLRTGATCLVVLFTAILPGVMADSASSVGSSDVVLYQEDFGDGQAQDWDLPGGWEVTDGALHGRGHTFAMYLGDAWGDFSFTARIRLVKGRIHLNYRLSSGTRYFIGFEETILDLRKTPPGGAARLLKSVAQSRSRGRWYEVTVTGTQGRIEVYVDGTRKLSYTDPDPILYGTIGVETLDNAEYYVDDIRVTGQPEATTGLQWFKTGGPIGGLGYDVRMRLDDPDVMYVTDAWSGVNVSSDGGHTWTASNEGIQTRAGESGDAIPVFSLTIDPHDPQTIWCGTQNTRGIYRSVDGGETWQEKDSGVVEREGISFRGFTVDPRDSDIVYAAAEISSYAWTADHTQRRGREFDLTQGVVYKTVNGGETWSAIWRGDNLARYVWIAPDDPETLYVSTGIFDREAANSDPGRNLPGGVGILKSTDGGKTWRTLEVQNGLQNLYLGSLFMHPRDPAILLAAAGNNAYPSQSGVYRSTDGGETWRRVLTTQGPATSVEFAVSDPRVAYAGTAAAVYRSEDSGLTWRQMTAGGIYGPPGIRAGVPIDFQVDPRNADRLFVNNYGGGNFLSEDGGKTWVVASQGYTGSQLHDIAVAANAPLVAYVIGRTGPFRSATGGADWKGLNFDPATFAEWAALEIDPTDAETILVSDEHQGVILLSHDGGDIWEEVFRHPAARAQNAGQRYGFAALAFAPSNTSIMYAGLRHTTLAPPGYGLCKSIDGGATWGGANDSMAEDQNVSVIAVDPTSADVVYAGTVEKGLLKTTDGGTSWRTANAGLRILDVRAIAIDPSSPAVLYIGMENGGLYKSSNGGANWVMASSGMDPQAAVRGIVIDPANPQTLYAADLRTGVYRSTDGAQTWVKMNDGLRTRAVKALAISSDGSTLYAATEGEGVFRLDLRTASGG